MTWSRLPNAPEPGRGGTVLAALPTGVLARFGGFAGRELDGLDVFDPASQTWTSVEAQVEGGGEGPAKRSVQAFVGLDGLLEWDGKRVVAVMAMGEREGAPAELGHDGAGFVSLCSPCEGGQASCGRCKSLTDSRPICSSTRTHGPCSPTSPRPRPTRGRLSRPRPPRARRPKPGGGLRRPTCVAALSCSRAASMHRTSGSRTHGCSRWLWSEAWGRRRCPADAWHLSTALSCESLVQSLACGRMAQRRERAASGRQRQGGVLMLIENAVQPFLFHPTVMPVHLPCPANSMRIQ